MDDQLTELYADLLAGQYDCPDRIVLNAFFRMGHTPGGFRTWWRNLHGNDENLDKTHLMRYVTRFIRRVKAYTGKHDIPMLYCRPGERKHELAEQHVPTNPDFSGLLLVMVSRANGLVWDVHATKWGGIHLSKHYRFINHLFFHIIDPEWGHITIRMSSHPPFGAMVILNGHELVARQATEAGLDFEQSSNCFADIMQPTDLAQIAESSYAVHTIGQLRQVCNRWLYSTCLYFGLSQDERERSGFAYQYSLFQIEYSRNLIFKKPAQMEQVFDALIDRSRTYLTLERIKTIFGRKQRPHRKGRFKGQRVPEERIFETPAYDLTIFKIHFGSVTLKLYTKGENVLRAEAVVHNTKALKSKRSLEHFSSALTELRTLLVRFLNQLACLDRSFVADDTLDTIGHPTKVGKARVAGIDLNNLRLRTVMQAVIALAPAPRGFSVAELAAKVRSLLGWASDRYLARHAAYDLKKLRGKLWVTMIGKSRRYEPTPLGLKTMVALLTLRTKIFKPLLASVQDHPAISFNQRTDLDIQYGKVHSEMLELFQLLGISFQT
jgi:hypothetical protein